MTTNKLFLERPSGFNWIKIGLDTEDLLFVTGQFVGVAGF